MACLSKAWHDRRLETCHPAPTLFCQLSICVPPAALLGQGSALAHRTLGAGTLMPPAWAPSMCTAWLAGDELRLAFDTSETGP